jgi:hypothetical protein
MKFTFSVNIAVQVVAFVLQALNQLMPIVPAKYQLWVTFAIAVAQAVSALLAHFVNPDGSSAKLPYTPKP